LASAPRDLASAQDLSAMPRDLSAPPDLARVDLTAPRDLSQPADLSQPPQLLLGTSTVEPDDDYNTRGIAQAFQESAAARGVVDTLWVDFTPSNSAGKVYVGIYSNTNKNHPGSLLGSGSIVSPGVGWKAIPISATSVTAGVSYWIAILGTVSGQVH